MAKFWEIKTQQLWETAYDLKECLPQLEKVSADEIVNNLRGSGLEIVKEKSVVRPAWKRFTLPFALIFILILFVAMPFKFMFTGTWGYQKKWMHNWFKSVGF